MNETKETINGQKIRIIRLGNNASIIKSARVLTKEQVSQLKLKQIKPKQNPPINVNLKKASTSASIQTTAELQTIDQNRILQTYQRKTFFPPISKLQNVLVKKVSDQAEKEIQTESRCYVDTASQTDSTLLDFDLIADCDCDHLMQPKTSEPDTSEERQEKYKFFLDLRSCITFDSSGNTPIHTSVLENNIYATNHWCLILKMRRETADIRNKNGFTPLQMAVRNNCTPNIVYILLQNFASVASLDSEGNNVIHLAVECGRKDLLAVIIKYLQTHSSYMLTQELNAFNYEGQTPLMVACYHNNLEAAELLLEAGAEVNLRDQKSGRTALFIATEDMHDQLVKLLLKHNASAKISNFFGVSAYNVVFDLQVGEEIKEMIMSKEGHKRKVPTRPAKTLKVISKRKRIDDDILFGKLK